MIIRAYEVTDRSGIVALMAEFGAYLEALDPTLRTDFADEAPEYFTNKLFENVEQKQGEIFVAEKNGEIVGFIGGYKDEQSEEELMESRPSSPAFIQDVFVTQKMRHGGIGRALLERMEEYFKKSGCTLLRLEVFAPNSSARSFYAKNGYQERTIVLSKNLS